MKTYAHLDIHILMTLPYLYMEYNNFLLKYKNWFCICGLYFKINYKYYLHIICQLNYAMVIVAYLLPQFVTISIN